MSSIVEENLGNGGREERKSRRASFTMSSFTILLGRSVGGPDGGSVCSFVRVPRSCECFGELAPVTSGNDYGGVQLGSSFVRRTGISRCLGSCGDGPSFSFRRAFRARFDGGFGVCRGGSFAVSLIDLVCCEGPRCVSVRGNNPGCR